MRRGLGKAAIIVALLLQLETPDETLIGGPLPPPAKDCPSMPGRWNFAIGFTARWNPAPD
jgi:hypothetical protein